MELTQKDVATMLLIIKADYNAFGNLSKDEFDIVIKSWHNNLKEYPAEVIAEAFSKVIKTSKIKPTVAHIIEQISKMEQANNKSDQELWDELDKKSYEASYSIERFNNTYIPLGETKTQGQSARERFHEIYNELDPLIKEYLGNSEKRFYNIALMKQDEINFEMTRFFKAMPNIRERVKTKQELATNNLLVEKNIKKIEKN